MSGFKHRYRWQGTVVIEGLAGHPPRLGTPLAARQTKTKPWTQTVPLRRRGRLVGAGSLLLSRGLLACPRRLRSCAFARAGTPRVGERRHLRAQPRGSIDGRKTAPTEDTRRGLPLLKTKKTHPRPFDDLGCSVRPRRRVPLYSYASGFRPPLPGSLRSPLVAPGRPPPCGLGLVPDGDTAAGPNLSFVLACFFLHPSAHPRSIKAGSRMARTLAVRGPAQGTHGLATQTYFPRHDRPRVMLHRGFRRGKQPSRCNITAVIEHGARLGVQRRAICGGYPRIPPRTNSSHPPTLLRAGRLPAHPGGRAPPDPPNPLHRPARPGQPGRPADCAAKGSGPIQAGRPGNALSAPQHASRRQTGGTPHARRGPDAEPDRPSITPAGGAADLRPPHPPGLYGGGRGSLRKG